MKTAVIDVGGGLRGMYGAGVLDYCLDNGVTFEHCIGVSAGSANMASFLAGQKGRNYAFYLDYSFRKEYMSFNNFLTKGSYLDLDYIYGVLSNSDGENPLDCEALNASSSQYTVVASETVSGKTRYFTKADMKKDDYGILKASCCIPGVCRPCNVGGTLYYDGGISDPVPVKAALESGCDNIVLILTKPVDAVCSYKKEEILASLIKRKYPQTAKNLLLREQRYKEGIDLAESLEKQGKAIIIAPKDISGLDTLTKDKDALKRLYEAGYNDAARLK